MKYILLSLLLDQDVRSFCDEINKEILTTHSNKKKEEINIRAWPAMASSCCFTDTHIYHERSKAITNVIFDVRLIKGFNELGGNPGEVVSKCTNALGCCAEQRAANLLLSETKSFTELYSVKDIKFSTPYRPRTYTQMKMCNNCSRIFTNTKIE